MPWRSLYVVGETRVGTPRVVGFHKVYENNNLSYYFVSSKNNPPGYIEHVVYYITFSFGEVVKITDCLENMKIYVSDIVVSYKDKTILHLGNSGSIFVTSHGTVLACMCS